MILNQPGNFQKIIKLTIPKRGDMSFIERIKEQLNDPKQRRFGQEAGINRRDLEELIHHFEILDSAARALSDQEGDLYKQLHDTIEALYKNNRDGEYLIAVIMNTLTPLIRERMLQEQSDKRLHHHDSSKIKTSKTRIFNNPSKPWSK